MPHLLVGTITHRSLHEFHWFHFTISLLCISLGYFASWHMFVTLHLSQPFGSTHHRSKEINLANRNQKYYCRARMCDWQKEHLGSLSHKINMMNDLNVNCLSLGLDTPGWLNVEHFVARASNYGWPTKLHRYWSIMKMFFINCQILLLKDET